MQHRRGVLPQILVPVIVALLVGGTAPWWWTRLFDRPERRPDTYWLVVDSVQLSRDLSGAAVRVRAHVNGATFVHPSQAGVEWLEVGPDMSPGQFALPGFGGTLTLHFTMQARSGARTLDFASQQKVVIDLARQPMPVTGEYRLHRVEQATRAPAVSATVHYWITTEP